MLILDFIVYRIPNSSTSEFLLLMNALQLQRTFLDDHVI